MVALPRRRAVPPPVRDIAVQQAIVEPGPAPLPRALAGLALGLAAGGVAALLTPRPGRLPRGADSGPGGSAAP